MTKLIYKLFLLILFLLSCAKEKESNIPANSKYSLNEGKKWEMDASTRASIKKMNLLFESTNLLTDIDSFNRFAYRFDAELDSLIRSCTMSGEAHNQLHIFIQEIFQPLEELKVDSVLQDAKKSHQEIYAALKEYDYFFN